MNESARKRHAAKVEKHNESGTTMCTRCGEVKSCSEFRIGKNQCKSCMSEYDRERRTENPEIFRARDKKRYAANAEKFIKQAKKRYVVRVEKHSKLEKRKCTRCGEVKNRNDFAIGNSQCKSCRGEYDRKRYFRKQDVKKCRNCSEFKNYGEFEIHGFLCKSCMNKHVKKCFTCGESKSSSEFDDGRHHCKSCRNKYSRELVGKRRTENPDKYNEYMRGFRAANPAKIREYNRTRRAEHPEKVEKYNNNRKKQRAENPEKYRVLDRGRYAAYAEKNREYARKKRAENPEKVKQQRRKYRVENPEKCREIDKLHRAKRRGLGVVRINEYFKGSHFHHLLYDENGVKNMSIGIHIPKELYKSGHGRHNAFKQKEMNVIAIKWLVENSSGATKQKAIYLYSKYLHMPVLDFNSMFGYK
jgi:hypothetical protein